MQPTIWEWAIFLVSMGLTVYAFWHMGGGLLFGRRRAEAETERVQPASPSPSARSRLPWPLQLIAWLGDVSIRWVYAPLWRALVSVIKTLVSLPRALWSGSEQPAAPALVLSISVPPPVDYVTGFNRELRQNRNVGVVAATEAEVRNVTATTENERNPPLSRNLVIRAQAEMIARLLKSESLYIPDGRGGYKKIGQVALIRMATGLEPNGRPESDYGQLKAELDPLIRPEVTISNVRAIAK